MTSNDIAMGVKQAFHDNSPVDTGQLRASASDLGRISGGMLLSSAEVGFQLFGVHGQGYYGSILNENAKIKYRVRDRQTGRLYYGEYPNKHYMYVDNFFESYANSLPFLMPGLRRVI